MIIDKPTSDLDPEDAENEEESAADEDDVADGFERDEERLDHQLQSFRSLLLEDI